MGNEAAPLSRTEMLLAMLLVQSMQSSSQLEKCVALNHAGLSNQIVGDLLGTSAAVVGQNLYEARKAKKSPARSASPAKSAKKSQPKTSKQSKR